MASKGLPAWCLPLRRPCVWSLCSWLRLVRKHQTQGLHFSASLAKVDAHQVATLAGVRPPLQASLFVAPRRQEKPDGVASLLPVGLFLSALRSFVATLVRDEQTQPLRSFASAHPSPSSLLWSLRFRVRCFPSSLRDVWKHLTLPLRSYSATLACVHLSWFASLSKKGGRTPAPLHAPLPRRRSVQTANRYAANRLHQTA